MELSVTFICAQVIGALIFILNIIGSTKITTKKVYTYNSICNALGGIQYALLGAWSGAVCCVITLLRNYVFSKFKKKVPLYVLLIYVAIVIVLNYNLIHSALDIIPVVNIIIYAMALWTKDIMNIKIVGFYTCFSGIVYDIKKGAFVTALNEIIDGVIAVKCIMVLVKKSKKKKKK